MRVVLSNRISSNEIEWVSNFQLHNSGTHNNQWMVVNLQDQQALFLEQYYGLMKVNNLTELMVKQQYLASYNVPYDSQIYDYGSYLSQSHLLLHKRKFLVLLPLHLQFGPACSIHRPVDLRRRFFPSSVASVAED
jgi:hypothetical protein